MKESQSLQNLRELARTLSINYINASIDLKENEVLSKDVLDQISTLDLQPGDYRSAVGAPDHGQRIILVTGAGLSYNAFEDIPLANEAIKLLHKSLDFGVDANNEKLTFHDVIHSSSDDDKIRSNGLANIRQKYLEELNRLRLYSTASRKESKEIDFETSLALLSYFFPNTQIRDTLYELYSRRFGPTLYHDIISHLFKHRFIDIIINFNFDELLDQCIEDEVGENRYISIISDGDCRPMQELLISEKLKQPIYIKPHGTYSHKSTLRFTKDQYDQLPYDMSKLLEDIVTCKNDDGLASSPVLIVAGFALKSIEFNEILHKVEGPLTIFYFSVGDHDSAEKEVAKYCENGELDFRPIHIRELATGVENVPEYDVALAELWHLIEENFYHHFRPRGISRHKIIQSIFGNNDFWQAIQHSSTASEPSLKDYFDSPEYFKDRAGIEAVLESLKLDGQISIDYLLSSTAGAYFAKYYFEATKADTDQTTVLSFIEFLEQIGFEVDYLNNHCRMKPSFDKDYIQNRSVLSPILRQQLVNRHDELTALVKEYRASRKSVISIDYDSRYYLAYRKYATHQLLTTNLSLEYELTKRFQQKWTDILIVEDTGLTLELYQDKIAKNADSLLAILADRSKYIKYPANEKALRNAMGKDILQPILSLPVAEHDHHMTIFINRDKGIVDSIYYLQKGLSNTINPIVISEKENLMIVLDMFEQYLIAAADHSKQSVSATLVDSIRALLPTNSKPKKTNNRLPRAS